MRWPWRTVSLLLEQRWWPCGSQQQMKSLLDVWLETRCFDIKMKNEYQWSIRMVLSIHISFINNLRQHYHSTNLTITTLSLWTPNTLHITHLFIHTIHNSLSCPLIHKTILLLPFIHSITAFSTHSTHCHPHSFLHSLTQPCSLHFWMECGAFSVVDMLCEIVLISSCIFIAQDWAIMPSTTKLYHQ